MEKSYIEHFEILNMLSFSKGLLIRRYKGTTTKTTMSCIFRNYQMFKITFLHDENIFLIQISFFDLEYELRIQETICERSRNCTERARAQNLYFSLLFVLDVVWGPSAWWILCTASNRVFFLLAVLITVFIE